MKHFRQVTVTFNIEVEDYGFDSNMLVRSRRAIENEFFYERNNLNITYIKDSPYCMSTLEVGNYSVQDNKK